MVSTHCGAAHGTSLREGRTRRRTRHSRRTDDVSCGEPSRRLTSRASWLGRGTLPLSATSKLRNAIYCVLPGERRLQGGNVCCYADVWRAERCCHGRFQLGEAFNEIERSCVTPSVTACAPAEGTEWCLGDDGVRQSVESNAFFFSLDQPEAGFLVKSMRLIPSTWLAGLRKSQIAAAPT